MAEYALILAIVSIVMIVILAALGILVGSSAGLPVEP